jgi:hypothetical protein
MELRKDENSHQQTFQPQSPGPQGEDDKWWVNHHKLISLQSSKRCQPIGGSMILSA